MFKSAKREAYVKTLRNLFKRDVVAQLADLRLALGVRSRTTVFFALREAGSCTSYTHAGRYYTLAGIPRFDANGLWEYRGIRFSKHGTLRATVAVLVKQAPQGRTHDELQVVLKLRVHDALRGLTKEGLLGRERVDGIYVYTDPDPARAAAQVERRSHTKDSAPASARPPASLDLARVVDVLLAVIESPKDDAATIAARLRLGGVGVTDAEVLSVFTRYELEKKTARSRSRRSRR
jgi:hypothetical protein